MSYVFISYRRADSQTITGRINDRLVAAFDTKHIFKDVDDIQPGTDFRSAIQQAIQVCDVVLVIIGPDWLQITDTQGRRRLDDPEDFVRLEVHTALQRPETRVIPVLVKQAAMPSATALPADLVDLAYRHAVVVRDDPDFHTDMDRLIDTIKTGDTQPAKAHSKRHLTTLLIVASVIAIALLVVTGMALLPLLSYSVSPSPTALVIQPTTVAPPTTTQTDTAAPPTDTSVPPIPTLVSPVSTVIASDTPIPATATPVPPTATAVPHTATAVPATATAVPATDTAIPATDTPLPTVLYPNGRQIQLLWNEASFYVWNTSDESIRVSRLTFEALHPDGYPLAYAFSGGLWSQFYGLLEPFKCDGIEVDGGSALLKPSQCSGYNAFMTPETGDTTLFWIAQDAVTQFRILWNEQEVARCPLATGTCIVFLPPGT